MKRKRQPPKQQRVSHSESSFLFNSTPSGCLQLVSNTFRRQFKWNDTSHMQEWEWENINRSNWLWMQCCKYGWWEKAGARPSRVEFDWRVSFGVVGTGEDGEIRFHLNSVRGVRTRSIRCRELCRDNFPHFQSRETTVVRRWKETCLPNRIIALKLKSFHLNCAQTLFNSLRETLPVKLSLCYCKYIGSFSCHFIAGEWTSHSHICRCISIMAAEVEGTWSHQVVTGVIRNVQ